MADELDEARLAVLVNLTQQVFGDVRVFFVQQFGQLFGLLTAHCLAVLDLLQHRVVRGEFGDQVFHHFAVAGDTDRLVLWAELHPFLLVQLIGQIEVGLLLAGGLLAEFHQRAELGDQFVEGVFIRLGPVVAGLRGADQGLFLLDEADRERQFADLLDDAFLEGVGLFLLLAQNGQRVLQQVALEAHGFEVGLGHGAEQRFDVSTEELQPVVAEADPEVVIIQPRQRGGGFLDHHRLFG
ncbi:hypothetical protein D3C71_1540860 [compost metagenome]